VSRIIHSSCTKSLLARRQLYTAWAGATTCPVAGDVWGEWVALPQSSILINATTLPHIRCHVAVCLQGGSGVLGVSIFPPHASLLTLSFCVPASHFCGLSSHFHVLPSHFAVTHNTRGHDVVRGGAESSPGSFESLSYTCHTSHVSGTCHTIQCWARWFTH
jgi:hypothetical protein